MIPYYKSVLFMDVRNLNGENYRLFRKKAGHMSRNARRVRKTLQESGDYFKVVPTEVNLSISHSLSVYVPPVFKTFR